MMDKKYRADYLISNQYVKCKNVKTGKYFTFHLDTIVEKEGGEKATCDNCKNKGTDVCENENAKKYGFCGNWTMKEGEAE